MSSWLRSALVVLTASGIFPFCATAQQAPQALPNTFSAYGGGGGTAYTAGAACFAGSTLTATDTLGDGCPATLGNFSTDLRGGVATDPAGNVYVLDTNNSAVRVINARSGIISLFAGKGVACSSKTDSNGDNCPLANTVFSASPRGIATDPWGNVLIAGYGTNLVNVACTTVSPLCPNTAGTHQVGSMYLVAGCVAATGSAGSAGAPTDGGTATPTGTCSSSVSELNQPRGVAADRYGNIYIADTANVRFRVVVGPASFNGVANPMASVIAMNPTYSSVTATSAAGNIYPLLGGGTSPASGAACTTGSATVSLDAYGDGCPYFVSSLNSPSTSAVQAVTVDPSGNVIFMDLSTNRLRVIYMGGAQMAAAITTNNSTVTTPQVGSIYSIAGGGTTSTTTAPLLGKGASIDTNAFKVTTDNSGNIYIGDNTFVLFYDIRSGYIRRLITNGAVCAGATDSLGDGCPATQATFGGSNGLGVALNGLGDLFMADSTNSRVRRVAAGSLLPTTVNASSTQTVVLHGAPGTTGIAASLANTAASNPISLGATTCGSILADGTMDCSVPVTFAPISPSVHSSTLAAASTGVAGTVTIPLAGNASGAALVFDAAGAVATTIGTGLKPTALATDGNGNLFSYDLNTSALVKVSPAGVVTTLPGALLGAPAQIALDNSGNLYAVGDGSATILKVSLSAGGTYTAGTVAFVPYGAAAVPGAVAVDGNGTLYVYDTVSKAVYRQSTSPLGNIITTISSGFNSVNSLALDGLGNLLVSDSGAQMIYVVRASGARSSLAAGTTSLGLATDAAGTVYSLDSNTLSVIDYPLSGSPSTSVYSSLTSPSGIAVDPAGNVFIADTTQSGVLFVSRNASTLAFGTNSTITKAGTITNVGNAASSGLAQTDSADFQLVAGTSNGCNIAGTSFAPGLACTVVVSFTPQSGTGAVTDAVTFLPATSSTGSLSLTGIKTGATVTATTTIVNQTPTSPIYNASATEVSFTLSVAASAGTASGSVAVTVDSGSPVSYTLDGSGNATVALTGLVVGTHSITASYATQNGFTGSSTVSATSFSVGQAPVTVSWTPAATTQPFSKALGATVLNATAVLAGTSTPAPGNFVYSLTPSGGAATQVDASSYLAIGTYSMAVTFVPADAVNYGGGTASVPSYSVTQASTTAAVGATQNLVAADGTGNFTSVQAAVNSPPTSGGSIYIKPGSYSGFVTVVQPNTSLRGLGGDPAQVILTNEAGAFSPPYLGGQSAGNNGSTGDQGSATLVVAKGTVNGVTGTPNNFYMEGVTVTNTYDTDTTNSNTVGTIANVCQTITTPTNNFALYNGANTAASPGLCNSQALAMWITSDQAVLNSVRLNSLQDTLYAGSQGCGAACVVSRQYYWRGKITGDVDYLFGDAAAVFDHANIFTVYHGASATGTATIQAQNKKFATGSSGDYLSGYVFNRATFTSQSTGMTNLYYGRPYGQYSTSVLLNSYVDQVNPLGYLEFSGQANLPTSTYAEYNTTPYTDPTPGQPDVNGVIYTGAGGNSGAGVTGTRETTSIQPTTFTASQAAPWFPVNFLGATVGAASLSSGESASWDPVAALTNGANAFVPSASPSSVNQGSSLTILMRPQTPGAGTIPTGSWTLFDGAATVASGTLDASGQAYYTTRSLASGSHSFTWTYSGDSNFTGSTTTTPYVVTIVAPKQTPLVSIQPSTNPPYGSSVNIAITVAPSSGTVVPTGTVSLSVDAGAATTATLSSGGTYPFVLNGLSAGPHSLSVSYAGDTNFTTAIINSSVNVAKAVLQVAASSFTIAAGAADPTYTAAITGFVAGDTQATAVTGTPSLTTTPAAPSSPGSYSIAAALGTLSSANYSFTFANGTLTILSPPSTPAVATGDTRTVTEPSFPSVCTALTAAITSANNDIPASFDTTNTNPDGSRIQAALNSCAGTNQAVRLSGDTAGHDAYLSGPLAMPSGVTLLVDPGITVYFSRNVQDYDIVPGTHTCGTVNSSSATSSCLPLINISNVSNVGIMGYGKLDGRGGDVLLNTFPSSYAGQSWWGLSAIANSGGSQQNPRFIQISRSTNVTLYKITLRNSPLFHISTTGGQGVNGFTAWDIKIVTPTSARNTDGIDPGASQNVTVTRSWVSDGDDNIAVGASGSVSSQNISIIGNHFFAGHGESIGSYTSGGVNNVLFDNNMLAGNSTVDSNSTAIRIKSANDRGGVVTNIQYSNSCFQNHKINVQFTPLYNTNTGTLTPNFKNLLLQNLYFLTEGTVQFTGANNDGTINPLTATLDNVSFRTINASDFNTATTNAQLTYGPGQVSSNFVAGFQPLVGSNGNTLTDSRTVTALYPPACTFTFLAPELTGPDGISQTIVAGQNATAVVILTPAVSGSAYPTGPVTLTNQATGAVTTATLSGSSDTLLVPIGGLGVGTHTFTASYAGDSNYVPSVSGSPYATAGPYTVTVTAGSLAATTTSLSGIANTTYGSGLTLTATVSGTNPTGTVQFTVNGAAYATASVGSNGTAQATLMLPVGSYNIQAIYSGDGVNAGSSSAAASSTVSPAATTTTLTSNISTTSLGIPVRFTAVVNSSAGVPTGSVALSYTTASNATPTNLLSATLTNGSGTATVNLPIGTDSVTATYVASSSFASSSSTPPVVITVNPPVAVPLPTDPIALPYTISTLAGGSTAASANTTCSGTTDAFGNGCQATSITLTASALDLRSVVADPFGNVYFTDANASQVRRIAPNGVVTLFAGYVTGTACVPTATASCTPTLVKLNKPRGISADPLGNIYIAGYSDNKVYKVSVNTGLLSLVAGTGSRPSDPTQANGDGAAATSALINQPRGVWADSVGTIYIADTADNKIRAVDVTGNIQTIAGTGASSSTGDNGPANLATVSNPQGVLADPSGNVYIADASRIRVVCVTCTPGSGLYLLLNKIGITAPQNGNIYTLAGGGSGAYSAPALANTITMSPQKLAMDNSGNLYVSDGSGVIWFIDSRTAYIHPIAGGATPATTCNPTALPNIGDGCPATRAIIGNAGNGIGVGTDTQGNLYISDTMDARIRKVSNNLAFSKTATGSSTNQTIELHLIAGDSLASTNGIPLTGSEFSVAAQPPCTTNSDTTVDCLLSATFAPAIPGQRTSTLAAITTNSDRTALGLTGMGLGAGATLDPAKQLTFGGNLQVNGIAVDTVGNVFVADGNSKGLLRFNAATLAQGASAPSTTLATLTAPGAVTIDSRGSVFVADTSTGQITQVSNAGIVTTLPFKFVVPAGMTVDSLNNLYVSDAAVPAVYQLNPSTGAQKTLTITGLVSPAGLAIDPSGKLLVTDPGATSVYRFDLQSAITSTQSTTTAKPSGVVVDAAGNLILADAASIVANPASTNSTAFTISTITPTALAIDGAGDIFTNSGSSVVELIRTQGLGIFPSPTVTAQSVNLLSTGNQPLSISTIAQTDATDFTLINTAATDCVIGTSPALALPVGGACTGIASFNPVTYGTFTDAITFSGNASNATLANPASIQLNLTGSNPAPATTTTLRALVPASPVYGQTITVTAAATSAGGIPAGSVTFTIDSNSTTVALVNGAASTNLTGLAAGTHTVTAAYVTTANFAASTSGALNFTVSKGTPSVTIAANPSTQVAGSIVTLTATVTSPSSTPTGTVQFYNGAVALGSPISLAGGTSALLSTTALPVGSDSVTAAYSGDTNYNAVTSAASTITVSNPSIGAKAVTTLAITASPSIPSGGLPQGTNETFNATLTSSVATTGTITFFDGSNSISAAIPLSANGTASFSTTTFAVGSHSISARYSGDINNQASLSTAISFTTLSSLLPAFSTAAGSTSVTVAAGASATTTLTVTPNTLYGGTVTFSCGGNPATLGCSFSPTSLTFSTASAAAQSTTLTLTAAAGSASMRPSSFNNSAIRLAALFGIPGILLVSLQRRRWATGVRRLTILLLLLAASFGAIGVTGCGGDSHGNSGNILLAVTANDGTNSRITLINVTVTH